MCLRFVVCCVVCDCLLVVELWGCGVFVLVFVVFCCCLLVVVGLLCCSCLLCACMYIYIYGGICLYLCICWLVCLSCCVLGVRLLLLLVGMMFGFACCPLLFLCFAFF